MAELMELDVMRMSAQNVPKGPHVQKMEIVFVILVLPELD
jgi:hypothetical protein